MYYYSPSNANLLKVKKFIAFFSVLILSVAVFQLNLNAFDGGGGGRTGDNDDPPTFGGLELTDDFECMKDRWSTSKKKEECNKNIDDKRLGVVKIGRAHV